MGDLAMARLQLPPHHWTQVHRNEVHVPDSYQTYTVEPRYPEHFVTEKSRRPVQISDLEMSLHI